MTESRQDDPQWVDSWEGVEGVLDSLLDLEELAREARLQEMDATEPERARLLRRLLSEAAPTDSGVARFAPLIDESRSGDEPRQVGPFEIVEQIAQGGMGTVYRARRVKGGFEQIVALKLLRQAWSDEKSLDRFLRERQLLADLQHPNIAHLIDGGLTAEGAPYIALEFIEGLPITEGCDRLRLDLGERIALFDQVLDAVAYAHRKLIIHRDLKPPNIYLSDAREVKLLDFGIAKILDDTTADETRTLERALTPTYAAPEQLLGEPVTTATDIYGLGLVLYELLSGLRTFPDRKTTTRALHEIDADPPSMTTAMKGIEESQARAIAADRRLPVRSLTRSLRGDLEAIVARCLRREPEQRYPTVDALRSDLDRFRQGEPVQAVRGNWIYKAGKTWRHHWPAFLAATAVLGSLVTGLWVSVEQTRTARLAEAKAEAINRFLTRQLLGAADPSIGETDLSLRQVVDATERTVAGAFRAQPELEATVRRTLGSVRLSLGDIDSARRQIAQALELLEASGDDPQERAELRLLTAELELQQSRFAEARAAAGEGLTLVTELRDPGHPDILRAHIVLARIDLAAADPIAAERRLEAALSALDPEATDSREVSLEARVWLADALEGQARRGEAVEVLEQVLATREIELGPEHPRVAEILGPLAKTLAFLETAPEAEGLARRALEINRATFGDPHPRTLAAVYDLAYVLGRLGLPAEAKEVTLPWHSFITDALEKGSPTAIRILNNLAISEARLGNDGQAERYYRAALDASEKTFGNSHDRTMVIRRNLSNFLGRQGKTEEALRLASDVKRIALEIAGNGSADAMYLAQNAWFLARPRAVGAQDLDTALLLARQAVSQPEGYGYYPWVALSEVHYQRGELEAAIDAELRALEHPDALHRAGEERYMVMLFREKGDLQAAETFLREHLVRRQAVRDPDDPLIGHTLALLGRNLLAQGRSLEAEPVLRQSLAIFERRPPPADSPWHVYALSDLGAIQLEGGQLEDADELFARALEALEGIRGSRWQAERVLLLERQALTAEDTGRPEEAQQLRVQALELAGEE